MVCGLRELDASVLVYAAILVKQTSNELQALFDTGEEILFRDMLVA